MTTTTAKTNKTPSSMESLADRVAEATNAATGVAREATDAATDAAREADRTLRDSPDEALGMVGALSVGIAIGMVATNAPRILIAAALVPAAFVAWVYLQRSDIGTRGAS
jgi:hypothetical protein